MNSNKSWLRSFLVTWGKTAFGLIAVAACSLTAAVIYNINENQYLTSKTESVAKGISYRLEAEIRNRTAILNVLAESVRLQDNKSFDKMAARLIQEYPGFYAINFVNSKGIIVRVYPVDSNQVALGQNLLERADVANYLKTARDDRSAKMSHKLMTYQKVPAFTLYVPLYSNQNEFLGWLNAVVDFDNWLLEFMKSRGLHHTRIMLEWDHPESTAIDQGSKEVSRFFNYSHQFLNQKVQVKIGFAQSDVDFTRERHYVFILLVGAGLLTLALVLIVSLQRSKANLYVVNRNLEIKNTYLRSLSHDISSPLTALTLILTKVLAAYPKFEDKERIIRYLSVMKEMLSGVKQLHANELGIIQIKTEPVEISEIVKETLQLMSAQAQQKNVQFMISSLPRETYVLAESNSLKNNVLSNAFNNAIKFSPHGGAIKISCEFQDHQVRIVIEDEGAGLTDEQRTKLQKLMMIESTTGTDGEKGTGLGLLQIQGFMSAYGGRVEMANTDPLGCKMILIFKKG